MTKFSNTLALSAIAAIFALNGPAMADSHGKQGEKMKDAAHAHDGSVEETAREHGQAKTEEKEFEKAEKEAEKAEEKADKDAMKAQKKAEKDHDDDHDDD